jgi:hypothetical protein
VDPQRETCRPERTEGRSGLIRRARREGVPFDEIDRSLLAEVSGLTASELAEAYREAARRAEAEAEAEQLENFSRRARAE